MDALDRYIFKTCFQSFLIILVSLTGVIWVTQILRQVDLITSQGQTILVFLSITSLIIPSLMLILAPIAMLIAVLNTLVKLNNDSELVVFSAAGVSAGRLFRPFILLAAVVSALVLFIGAYLSPRLQRELVRQVSHVRADLVGNIIRPGTFSSIENGLTFHIREKRNDSEFSGILIDDFRNKDQRITVIAEQGYIVQDGRGTFLVMKDGWVHRRRSKDRDPTFVQFDRYPFDLSPYTVGGKVTYGLRERYLWDLAFPDPNDPLLKSAPGQFRAELHDRLIAPLYPFAFVVIAFAFLCIPRTTRQGGVLAIIVVCVSVFGLRLFGFACTAVGQSVPEMLILPYPVVVAATAAGLYGIYRLGGIDVSTRVDVTKLQNRLLGTFGRLARATPR